MMKNYLIIILFNLIGINAISQTNFWLQQAGGSGNDEALAVANFQNFTYTTGYYSEYAQFGSANFSQTGSGDIFVSKQAPTGEFLWTKRFGTPFPDRGLCITVLPNGNICVGGTTSGTINFGNTQLTTNNNGEDIFLVCLNPQGTVIWAKLFGSSDSDEITDVKSDANNNIVFTGRFRDSLQIGNSTLVSGINPDNENRPTYDVFVAKLDANGNSIWTNHGKTNRNDRSLRLAIAPDNSIYSTGIFSNSIDFNNSFNGNIFSYSNTSNSMGYLMKMTTNGDISWIRRTWSNITSIEGVTCTNDRVYIAGNFKGKLRIAKTDSHTPSEIFQEPLETIKYYVASFKTNGNFN